MVKGGFKARALALLLAMAMVLCVIFADGGRNQASAKEGRVLTDVFGKVTVECVSDIEPCFLFSSYEIGTQVTETKQINMTVAANVTAVKAPLIEMIKDLAPDSTYASYDVVGFFTDDEYSKELITDVRIEEGNVDEFKVGKTYNLFVAFVIQNDEGEFQYSEITKGAEIRITAKKRGAYYDYLPTEEDNDEVLAAKVVKFNNIDWYIIEDDSTAVDVGTVTLFAKDPIGVSSFNDDLNDGNWYSTSKVKGYLDGLTAGDGFFAGVADAIVTIPSLTTKTFVGSGTYDTAENVKLYLLSSEEASALPRIITKCSSADGANDNRWWLRSPGDGDHGAASVSGANGSVNESGLLVSREFGVRPTLKLNLSSVIFSSDTNTFSMVVPVSEVTLDKTEKQTIKVGDQVSFTATVSPEDASFKTVKWSVNNSNVKLYTDKDCTREVGADATSTLTVYAKGEAIGSAKVTVTSSEDATKSASCSIKVKKRYSWEWVDGKWYEHNGTQVYEPVGSWGGDKKGTTYGDTSGWTAKNRWLKIDGKWYFFDKEGYMLKDAYQKDATGKIWYLGKNGALAGEKAATGWVQDSNGWMFYTDDQNTLKKTWKMINGNSYYFKADGYLAMNEFVQGWWVNKTGAWKDPVRYSWHKSGSKWWYGVKDGWYAKDRSYTIDGKTYTFDKKGYTK